ncbi:hypothetical protein NPIL_6851 [Nephila pilipes]|uniref:Uncharacterized protein n=1 Tax=Nephila pilipes TaxID=299642 RepID=A0A8X6ICJ9_NEPPI|nr:hypothetical protein NPIL_6851 [Nephila pilipes]
MVPRPCLHTFCANMVPHSAGKNQFYSGLRLLLAMVCYRQEAGPPEDKTEGDLWASRCGWWMQQNRFVSLWPWNFLRSNGHMCQLQIK